MKIYSETSIQDFEFWSGARDTVKHLTPEELDTIENMLIDIYPEGMDETALNDFFWFDDDTIAEWLGYADFDAIMSRELDKLEYIKNLLYEVAAGNTTIIKTTCERQNIDLSFDEDLRYNFTFPDGAIITGDIGNGGQGAIITAWER
jgi:hypothetical protein